MCIRFESFSTNTTIVLASNFFDAFGAKGFVTASALMLGYLVGMIPTHDTIDHADIISPLV